MEGELIKQQSSIEKVLNPSDVIISFLDSLKESTRKAYARDLLTFQSFIQASTLDNAIKELIGSGNGYANSIVMKYKTHMQEMKYSPNTINRRLYALKSLVNVLCISGIISWELKFKPLKSEVFRDTRGPGLENFRAMLNMLKDSKRPKDIRDKAILHLCFDMALRRSSVADLDIQDIDLEKQKMWVFLKGRSQKVLRSIPEKTANILEEWLKIRDVKEGPLFINFDRAGKGERLTGTSIYRIIKRIGEKVGVETRPHGIRHLAITEAIKETAKHGIGLDKVIGFSGHKNVQTLMIYNDNIQDMQGEIASMVSNLV